MIVCTSSPGLDLECATFILLSCTPETTRSRCFGSKYEVWLTISPVHEEMALFALSKVFQRISCTPNLVIVDPEKSWLQAYVNNGGSFDGFVVCCCKEVVGDFILALEIGNPGEFKSVLLCCEAVG